MSTPACATMQDCPTSARSVRSGYVGARSVVMLKINVALPKPDRSVSYTVQQIAMRERLAIGAAYEHAGKCLGRLPGARGAIRVPKTKWEIYWHGAQNEGYSLETLPDPEFVFDPGSSVVYVLRASNGLLKIGTTEDFLYRLKALRRLSPVPLQIVSVFNAEAADEKRAHDRFGNYRHHGEWFEPAQEILEWAKEKGVRR